MNRRGIALLIAMVALLALGIMTTTGVALGIREADLGRTAMADVKAEAAADAALAEGFRGWNSGLTPVAPGDSVTLPVRSIPGRVLGKLVLYSLGGSILSLRGTGESFGRSGVMLARSRVELLIRLDSASGDSLVYPRAITRAWRRIP